jgi:hypothetical protein
MATVRQRFDRPRVDDVEQTVRAELERVLAGKDLTGKQVVIAVGSRGVRNIGLVVRTIVRTLRLRGACPVIVPAMGSHGGATAEGQTGVLQRLGVSEEYCGAEIRSSMDVIRLGATADGIPITMDRHAFRADGGVILVNRIKTHTDFKGEIESGLMKMAAIGLGKHAAALELHRLGIHGIRDRMQDVARCVLASGRILCGVALLENAYDETAAIEAIDAAEIAAREPVLLAQSKRMMPLLPVDAIDVLIVDELGKEFSGTGLDTNIIGRMRIAGVPEPDSPRIRYIIVRDLSEATHGNALGIGLADVTTRRCFEKIDFQVTNENVATSTFLARAMIPMVLPSDRTALETALRACWGVAPESARIVHIANTLELERLHVSEALVEEIQGSNQIESVGPPESMAFDEHGNLAPRRLLP